MSGLKRYFLITLLCFAGLVLLAKDLKRIIRAIEKQDLERTLELIASSLENEKINPGAKYFLAKHLSYDSLAMFNMDSARLVIADALKDYENASYEVLEELSKNGVRIDDLAAVSSKIENQHWRRALDLQSPSSYDRFLRLYPLSTFRNKAVRNRDSLNWERVRFGYDPESYAVLLQDFPNSHLVEEIQTQYDSLLYFKSTATDKLEDYIQFLDNYPETPYRELIEQEIFLRSTATNDSAAFQRFLLKYQTPNLRVQAFDILYHLGVHNLPDHPRSDSLQEVRNFSLTAPLIPVLKGDGFEMVASSGEVLEGWTFSSLPPDYLCESVTGDLVFGRKEQWHVLNRLGQEIHRSDYSEVEDLGLGILFLRGDEGGKLVHKSGFVIQEQVEDASLVGGRWIKASKDGKYGLLSISGFQVAKFRYDDIFQDGAFWIFELDGEIAVYNLQSMLDQLPENSFDLDFRFDEIEVVSDSLLIGFRRDRECLLNAQLDFLIPWGEYEIFPEEPFYYTRKDSVYRIFGVPGFRNDMVVGGLRSSGTWFAFQKDTLWTIVNKHNFERYGPVDSIGFIGDRLCLIRSADSLALVLPSDTAIAVETESIPLVAKSLTGERIDSYFVFSKRFERKLFHIEGELLTSGNYDDIKVLNDSLFLVEKRGKAGIVSKTGDMVVNLNNDLIRQEGGVLLLLQEGLIGAYLLDSSSFITTKYEARLEPFGQFFRTRYDGKTGLIDREEQVIMPFVFDEINYWNDSLAWVKEEGMWSLVHMFDGSTLIEGIQRYDPLSRDDDLIFARVYAETGYGLVSSAGQVLLNPKFNEIINLGTQGDPVFFVEQFSPEAAYHIVFYLNKYGERIASEAYRPPEFERILCED